MRKLVEETQVFDGTFVDGNTFIDKDGNAYVLHKSIFDNKGGPNNKPGGGGGGGGGKQNPPPPPKDPEIKSPQQNQIYFDISKQVAYMWDGSAFVENPKETKRIAKIFNGA